MVTGYKHWEEAIGLDYYSIADKIWERWNRCPHIISNSLSIFRKISISALLTMPKPLTVWITINCGKFWKRWEYPTTRPASWEPCMQVRKQQLELDMNNRLVPNRKRSTSRLYIVTLLIELISRIHHVKSQAGIKIAGSNINNIIYANDTPLMAESKEELKCLLMTVKEESE